MTLMALGLLALLVPHWTQADCTKLVPEYNELASRVVHADTYGQFESDWRATNAAHVTRKFHLPPSMSIPLTPDNLAAKVEDLQQIAKTRITASGCQ